MRWTILPPIGVGAGEARVLRERPHLTLVEGAVGVLANYLAPLLCPCVVLLIRTPFVMHAPGAPTHDASTQYTTCRDQLARESETSSKLAL